MKERRLKVKQHIDGARPEAGRSTTCSLHKQQTYAAPHTARTSAVIASRYDRGERKSDSE